MQGACQVTSSLARTACTDARPLRYRRHHGRNAGAPTVCGCVLRQTKRGLTRGGVGREALALARPPARARVVRPRRGQTALAFAGLWTPWRGVRGPKRAPVEGRHELFDFLTTEADAIVAPIHPKAMPVRSKTDSKTRQASDGHRPETPEPFVYFQPDSASDSCFSEVGNYRSFSAMTPLPLPPYASRPGVIPVRHVPTFPRRSQRLVAASSCSAPRDVRRGEAGGRDRRAGGTWWEQTDWRDGRMRFRWINGDEAGDALVFGWPKLEA
jgi:hypothetical protein